MMATSSTIEANSKGMAKSVSMAAPISRTLSVGTSAPTHSVAAGNQGPDDARQKERAQEHAGDPLVSAQVGRFLGLLDAQQHEDEKKEHDHCPGIDDHLDEGHKLGIEQQVEPSQATEVDQQKEGAPHRAALGNDTHARSHGDDGQDEKEHHFHGGSVLLLLIVQDDRVGLG